MRTTPIAEVRELPADSIVHRITGTLKTIYGQKTGTIGSGKNSGNPWAIQNGVLEMAGAEVEVVFKDREPISPKWKGREIIIEAHKGDKGWSGVYAYDDDYKGNVKRKLKVTASGLVSLLEDGGQQTEQPQQPAKPQGQQAQEPEPRQQPAQRRTATETAPGSPEAVREVKRRALQMANLQLVCMNMIEHVVAPRFKATTGVEIDAPSKHAWAMNLCIQLQREGHQNRMPATMEGPAPKPQQQPTQPERPAGIPASAQWDGHGWIDQESGNYIF